MGCHVNSRSKGKRGELQVCSLLNEGFLESGLVTHYAERNLDQTRSGGYDVGIFARFINGDELRAVIEVKRCQNVTAAELDRHWRQAQRQAADVFKKPILAYRQNRQPWRFRVMASDALASKNLDGWIEMESGPFLQVIERFMD